jgi:hypothetical protein
VDSLYFDTADLTALAVIQLGGARIGMAGQASSGFDVAPVLLVKGDTGRAERVVTDGSRQALVAAPPFDDAEDGGAVQWLAGEHLECPGAD